MKTAVSLPDNLYKKADKLARKMKITRSQLYKTALEKYIDHFEDQKLIEKLNEFYSNNSDENSELREYKNRKIFKHSEW